MFGILSMALDCRQVSILSYVVEQQDMAMPHRNMVRKARDKCND